MAGINSYTGISSYVQTVYDDASFVARENIVVGNLVRSFNDRATDAARTNSLYGTVTLTSVDDTDDLTSQSFNPSTYKTLTPSEYGGQVFITDRRIENDPFGAREDAVAEIGQAVPAHIERNIVANFSSLTGGTVGGGGTAPQWARIYAAISLARNTNAGGEWNLVLHPYAWHHLGTAVAAQGAVSQTNAPDFQNAVMRNFYVGNVAGVNVYTSTYCASGGTSIYGALIHRDAIALDMRRPMRIEPERDASRRGWELNVTMKYATGVWRPEWGIALLGDATTPV